MKEPSSESWPLPLLLQGPAVASLRLNGTPLLIAGLEPLQVIFATHAMAHLFEAHDLDDLADRVFGTAGPLGGRTTSALPPFVRAAGAEQGFTLMIRRIGPDDAFVLVAALSADTAALGDGDDWTAAAPPPAESPPPATPVPAGEASFETVAADLRARYPQDRAVRFVWQSNEAGHLVEVSDAFLGLAGGQQSYGERLPLSAIMPEDSRPEGYDARQTWAGWAGLWPLHGVNAAIPVTLGATPLWQNGQFGGFRGFGLARPHDVQEGPQQPVARPNEAEPAAAVEPVIATPPVFDANVVPLASYRAAAKPAPEVGVQEPAGLAAETPNAPLTTTEQLAFDELARALSADGTEESAMDSTHAPPSEDRAAVLDRVPIGVLVTRFEIPLYLNRTMLDLVECESIDAFHDAGGLDTLFQQRVQAEDGIVPIRTAGGRDVLASVRLQKTIWAGEPATLMTVWPAETAATEQIEALEHRLARHDTERAELHAILDTAIDGVVVIDDKGRILSLNRSGEALFGYDQNEVAGESLTLLLAREDHGTSLDYLEQMKQTGVAGLMNDGREVLGRARQGGSIPLFMTLGRIGQDGKFCAVLRDMTAWKRAERELDGARQDAERSSALKSDFLAKISHEIRTPLNAIIGFAEVIMDERFGPIGVERYREYLKDIHASGNHVMSLVNDLLDLSKIEAGKLELDQTRVDVNRIVTECVSLMQPQASRERIILRVSLAPRLPDVMADERSLRQIVLNLLSNAVKFNEPGGQVIVSTAMTDSGQAVLRIRDTGIGMSDEDLETALEPFRQVATSRSSSSPHGTGLGLPLTKALVEANRAAFTIRSKRHEGTLVEVAFPPAQVLAAE